MLLPSQFDHFPIFCYNTELMFYTIQHSLRLTIQYITFLPTTAKIFSTPANTAGNFGQQKSQKNKIWHHLAHSGPKSSKTWRFLTPQTTLPGTFWHHSKRFLAPSGIGSLTPILFFSNPIAKCIIFRPSSKTVTL